MDKYTELLFKVMRGESSSNTALTFPTKQNVPIPPQKPQATTQRATTYAKGKAVVPTNDRQRYQESTRQGYQQALQDNAGARFHAGFMEGLSPVSLGLESEALEGSKAFLAGNIAGTMGQFAIPYAGVAPKIGKALSNVPKYAQMGKVGQAVARGVGTDLAVGVPLNTLYGVSKEGLEGKELAKSIGINTAIDLVAGGVLEVIGGVILKSGKKVATKAEFDALPKAEQAEALEEVSKQEIVRRQLKQQDRTIETISEVPTKPETYTKIEKEVKANVNKLLAGAKPELRTEVRNLIPSFVKGETSADDFIQSVYDAAVNIPYAKAGDKELLAGVRAFLKKGIKLTDDLRQIPDFKDFRIANAGKVKFSPDGSYVDVLYEELADMYGDVFPRTITHPVDQLQRIISVLDGSKAETIRLGDVLTETQIYDYVVFPVLDEVNDLLSLSKTRVKGTETVKGFPRYKLDNPVKPLNRPVQPRTPQNRTVVPNARKTVTKQANNVIPPPIGGVTPNTGNINTAKAKINYGNKSTPRNLWQDFRTQFTDDMAPLEKLEKSVRGKVSSAESSIYKQSRLYKGIPEKANLIIDNELKPIVKSVEKSGKSYKDLGLYAEAVHARDVNRAGLKSGFTDAEIDDVIRTLGTPEMETARKQLVEYSNRRLQSLVDADVITQSQFDAMRSKWKNYMPLNRAFDDAKVEFGAGITKALTTGQSPLQALKGSDRQIIDPIESMIKNTYKTELAVGKNKIGKQLADLATEDTTGAFVRKLKKGEEVGRKNVVSTIENGQKVSFEVTPEVYKALKGLNNEATNMLIKVFQAPASVLRAGAVLTPEFAMRNPMRDVQQAFINSGSGFNPITDFTAGLASYIKKGDLYQEFIKNSAGYGNIISMDRKKHKEIVQSMLTKTPAEKAINVINPQTWLRVLRNISDATESATKIGEFRAALRSGATPQEAAYRARDLMDFARAGSSVRQVNKVVAFLNANIQSKSKMIRSIQRDPLGVGVRLVTSMAVPSVGVYALNHQLANERQKAQIKDAPTWLRDTFWLVAVPGTDIVARIPKPFEGAAVSNVVERFMDFMAGNDPEAFDGFIGDIVRDQSIPVMLTGITPIVEGMANYSFFRDAPLIPQREKYVERKDQQDIYTSETAKVLAGGVEKVFGGETNFASPRVMDNTIKGLTAGLGTYATDAIDAMIGKNKPAKNVSQLPVIKAFTVNETSTGKSMDFLYSEVDKLTKAKNSNKETFDKEKELKYLNAVKGEISELSKEIRAIQNDPKMSPEAKREKLNTLMRKRNDLAIKAVEDYKKGNKLIVPFKK